MRQSVPERAAAREGRAASARGAGREKRHHGQWERVARLRRLVARVGAGEKARPGKDRAEMGTGAERGVVGERVETGERYNRESAH